MGIAHVGLSDEPFYGYTFKGPPPREQPRMWFLDRQIDLAVYGARRGEDLVWNGDGTWTIRLPDQSGLAAPGTLLRYDHGDDSQVWRLTEVTIPHVHTFHRETGGEDDTWRLGLWPD